MPFQESHAVVVIGAGLAGLAAARALMLAGHSVVVLEAQDRVGGRTRSLVTEDGATIDLGAQWVSPRQERVQALIAELGLVTTRTHHEGRTLYLLGGKHKAVKGANPPLSPLALFDLIRLHADLERITRDVPLEAPWEHPRARALDATSMETWFRRHVHTRGANAFYRPVVQEIMCQGLEETSLLDLAWCFGTLGGTFEALETAEDQWVVGGTQQLAEGLARQLGDRVRLGTPVERIEHGEDGVTVHAADRAWRAARVIVAVPPVLAGRLRYDPPLPGRRDQLTQRSAPGSSLKCVVVYDRPFWREQGLNGTAFADEGPVTNTMDSSPPDGPHGVLTVLLGGEVARSMAELTPEARRAAVLSGLERLYGEAARHPVGYFEKDWSADPWARGGYAVHFGTGTITQFGPALMRPVGPIHWASTETATRWRLYMEGALEAGERAADEVRQALAARPVADGAVLTPSHDG